MSLIDLSRSLFTFFEDEVEIFSTSSFIFGLPGLTYFISSQWAIAGNIGQLFFNYKKEKLGTDSSEEQDSVTKNFGVSFQFNTFGIGVQYYLRNAAE